MPKSPTLTSSGIVAPMTQLDLLAMQQSIQLEQQDEYLSEDQGQSGGTLGSTLSRLLSGGHTPSDHAGGPGNLIGLFILMAQYSFGHPFPS